MIPFVVVRDELAPGRPEERVAVMDEDPDVSQASVLGIGGVPHELGAPRPVGLEFLIRPPLATEPGPGSEMPTVCC